MSARDLLFEIGTEELPPRHIHNLAQTLAANLQAQLDRAELGYGEVRTFATPRRLAVLIRNVAGAQKTHTVEKRGPALKAAFDAEGHPTLACLGFASACGATVDQLVVRETDKGAWLFFSQEQGGMPSSELLPELIKQAVNQLPLKKPMRWGNHDTMFLRPVHWIVLLFGKKCLKTMVLGKPSGRITYGHRFHHPKAIRIQQPCDYETVLREQGKVIADFATRKRIIRQQVESSIAGKGHAVYDEALLNEVTGLVEWPVALVGEFAEQFLEVPAETVMIAMQSHQKYFPVVDDTQQLLPYFVTISNIQSQDPTRVIAGNERVIRARLADAQFFYHSDLKHTLASRLNNLKKIIFQKKLGTLSDKAERIADISRYLATKQGMNTKQAARAGLLCKADLASSMVGEFPELQGVMGYYYALEDDEPAAVAHAIREHYQPRFSGDTLPETPLGGLVSIADKLDTLVGLFGVNQPPSGEKDPYGLRRAALGILRILIEKQLALDLRDAINQTLTLYTTQIENPETATQTFDFIMERLRAWYTDKGIDSNVFAAVLARQLTTPLDFHHRVQAVQHFQTFPEAKSLIAAHKRVTHLLKEQTSSFHQPINPTLLQNDAERELLAAVEQRSREIEPLYHQGKYMQVLSTLATLQTPVDHFFDHVMVMVEDLALRNNRLALLYQLQQLFLQVADISLL